MKVLSEEIIQIEDIEAVFQYKDIQNISIRINNENKVLVSLPYGSKIKAVAFVKEKLDWLRKHLAKRSEQEYAVPDNGFDGTNIWLWGKHYVAVFVKADSETVSLHGEEIVYTYKGQLTERKQQILVEAFYKQCLEQMLTLALESWQPKLSLYASSWKIRRLKSKWGRCNVLTKELLFNISLVHRPLACLEYVVLHELAHLYEASHNQRFQNYLTKYMPNWKERRKLVNNFNFKR